MLKYISFSFLLCIGSGVYFLQLLNYSLPDFINFYLNDLLIVPLSCYIALFVVQFIHGPLAKLPCLLVILLCGYYSFYFEWYLPKYNVRYTADIFDVLCYFTGGLLFLLMQKRQVSA